MTMEPASTPANWINSDCLDWSYIGNSLRLGIRRKRGMRGSDPRLACRRPEPMGRRRPALRQPGCVHLRSLRQSLRVYVLPNARQPAVLNRDGEDPVVLEWLVR